MEQGEGTTAIRKGKHLNHTELFSMAFCVSGNAAAGGGIPNDGISVLTPLNDF